jgi:hypothetical protein
MLFDSCAYGDVVSSDDDIGARFVTYRPTALQVLIDDKADCGTQRQRDNPDHQ